jgi:transposase
MLETEEWLMIRDLHAQGLNITAISNKTGFDRKTVRKYLNLASIPEPKQRAKKESKLDEYKDYIIKKLHEGPFTAVRLFREIQAMGFAGKYTIVKDFVRIDSKVQKLYCFNTELGYSRMRYIERDSLR